MLEVRERSRRLCAGGDEADGEGQCARWRWDGERGRTQTTGTCKKLKILTD